LNMNDEAMVATVAVRKMVIVCDSHGVNEPLKNNSFKLSYTVINNAVPRNMPPNRHLSGGWPGIVLMAGCVGRKTSRIGCILDIASLWFFFQVRN
jgi:hypothetical protein